MKRTVLLTLTALLLSPLASVDAATGTSKPNILILVADDMGYADSGVYHCKDIPTPNIDTLARNGTRFSNGYVSGCVCSPSRAALLTGRYQQRFGFDANAEGKSKPNDKSPRALDIGQVTIAQRMKELGYTTGIIGKWHVGAGEGYLPTQRGFDEFYGYLPFGIAAEPPNGPPIYRGTNIVERPKNHMEQFCTEAISFLDRHAKEPFLLYMPFSAVHGPYVGPQPWLARFDDMTPANRRKYAADLSQMDDIIGRVMAKVHSLGLEENTLVFFISDNGGPGGASCNAPLRGTKWTVWEGGIRVPFIVQWKGHIPADRVLEQQVMQIDFLPTAVAAAGGEVKPAWNLDGVNLLPLLEGKATAAPHAALYWRFGVQYAVRQGNWKLVKPSIESAPLLFDLAKDIGEQNDRAAAEPERMKDLQALWDAWNAKNEPPRWIDERWNGHGTEGHKAGKGGKGVKSVKK